MLHVESIVPGDYITNVVTSTVFLVVSTKECHGCKKYGHRGDIVSSIWGFVSESKGTYMCELLHCSGTLSTWYKINTYD